jgi:hypothetical protein
MQQEMERKATLFRRHVERALSKCFSGKRIEKKRAVPMLRTAV